MIKLGIFKIFKRERNVNGINVDNNTNIKNIPFYSNANIFNKFNTDTTEIIFTPLNNNNNNNVGIASYDKTYPDFSSEIDEGEIVIFSKNGKKIKVKNDNIIIEGDVELTGNISIAGNLTVDGDISATGNITSSGDITADSDIGDSKGTLDELRQEFNAHIHNDSTGLPTTPPL